MITFSLLIKVFRLKILILTIFLLEIRIEDKRWYKVKTDNYISYKFLFINKQK